MATGATSATVFGSLVLLVVSGVLLELSSAAVYTVGDSAGWTIMGNPNYTAWSSSKTFHLGDTIVFVYNNQFHNVLEVSKEDYRACNAQSPIATYTSGKDSVPIKRRGHHFFLCGVPGHCQIGQKVDIRVPKLSSPTAAAGGSPSAAPTDQPSSTLASPPPAESAVGGGAASSGPSAGANHDVSRAGGGVSLGWGMALVVVMMSVAVSATTGLML